MQGIPYLNEVEISESQMNRLGECAYRILAKLKSTKEGRKMLREEIALMRREREGAKC